MRNETGRVDRHSLWRLAMSVPVLSASAEPQLARQAQQGSKPAFDRLLRAHLRLVLSIVRDFSGFGLPVDDVVSEGLLGLCEAARRFDPERGVPLAAYAAWWIRAYMRRYTIMNRRIVRSPSSRHGRKLLASLRTTQRELTQTTGEVPDLESVASKIGVRVRDVEEMEAALSGRDLSYGANLGSIELSSDTPSPEVLFAEAEQEAGSAEAVGRALEVLSARERQVLQQRYLSGEEASLALIGRGMGLSRERVRQIEHKARTKVRHALLSSVAKHKFPQSVRTA